MIYSKTTRILLSLVGIIPFLIACQPQSDNKQLEAIDKATDEKALTVIEFQNSLFSIPSPYQMAGMIKSKKIEFNLDLLNPTHNNMKYNDNFYKSLNLGVYGADLAYANIYDQIPTTITYFGVIKLITQDLGLSHAFDANTIQRIEKNMTDKDSLLKIISASYRKADAFLKENQRSETGILILTGGWIESLYIITKLAIEKPNKELTSWIGEHKYPLKNLIKMLQPYSSSKNGKELLDGLAGLENSFSNVEFIYVYKPPQTNEKENLTIVNSTSETKIEKEDLLNISKEIIKLRKFIIQEN